MGTKQRGKHSNKVEVQEAKSNSRQSNKPGKVEARANKVPRKGASSGKGGGSNAGGESKKRAIHGGRNRTGTRSNEKL